jgi:AcrR family transcriptional regulator
MQYLSQRLASKPAKAPGAGLPSGSLGADQRRRILDATEQLVAERGCGGTSIEAIVKAAGVSSVTFYEHFEDKEACFVAVFDRAVVEIGAALNAAGEGEEAWIDRVDAVLAALLATIATAPGRARLCLVEAQTAGPQLSARYDATVDAAASRLRRGRLLDTAPRELPETVEEAAVGGIAWLLRQQLERGEAETVEVLLPKLVEIALSPYLGAAGPPAASDG